MAYNVGFCYVYFLLPASFSGFGGKYAQTIRFILNYYTQNIEYRSPNDTSMNAYIGENDFQLWIVVHSPNDNDAPNGTFPHTHTGNIRHNE